jgi:hypothetical protein
MNASTNAVRAVVMAGAIVGLRQLKRAGRTEPTHAHEPATSAIRGTDKASRAGVSLMKQKRSRS